MFVLTFTCVFGVACALFLAGILGLILYAAYFLLDRFLLGFVTPDDK